MFKFSSISNLIFVWSNWLFETNHFGAASAGFSGVPVVLLPANHNVFDNVRRKNRKYEYKLDSFVKKIYQLTISRFFSVVGVNSSGSLYKKLWERCSTNYLIHLKIEREVHYKHILISTYHLAWRTRPKGYWNALHKHNSRLFCQERHRKLNHRPNCSCRRKYL